MNDRSAFLTAIRAAPDDDTLRLVYADWLDQHGAGDLDAATAEFIRVSCADRPRREIRPAAAQWLKGDRAWDGRDPEHWRRLIPSVMATHAAAGGNMPTVPYGFRSGRRIITKLWLPLAGYYPVRVRMYAVTFDFNRGFLTRASFTSAAAVGACVEAICRDQPLAEIEIKGLRRAPAAELLSRLQELAREGSGRPFVAKAG